MFQDDLPHPCTICVPSSKSSFLDDCRKSRGDHVVGLVTCSSAPISKQRVSQRTNNKHLLPSSHRVGEKQEQTRGKKGKSETQLICQAPQSPPASWEGEGVAPVTSTFPSQDVTKTKFSNFPVTRCDEDGDVVGWLEIRTCGTTSHKLRY